MRGEPGLARPAAAPADYWAARVVGDAAFMS